MRVGKGWAGRCYVPRPAFAFWIREYIRSCSGVQHVTIIRMCFCAAKGAPVGSSYLRA